MDLYVAALSSLRLMSILAGCQSGWNEKKPLSSWTGCDRSNKRSCSPRYCFVDYESGVWGVGAPSPAGRTESVFHVWTAFWFRGLIIMLIKGPAERGLVGTELQSGTHRVDDSDCSKASVMPWRQDLHRRWSSGWYLSYWCAAVRGYWKCCGNMEKEVYVWDNNGIKQCVSTQIKGNHQRKWRPTRNFFRSSQFRMSLHPSENEVESNCLIITYDLDANQYYSWPSWPGTFISHI